MAQKEEESERLRLASQSEQIEIARSAKDALGQRLWQPNAPPAAEGADARATIALIIAAISIGALFHAWRIQSAETAYPCQCQKCQKGLAQHHQLRPEHWFPKDTLDADSFAFGVLYGGKPDDLFGRNSG